MDRQKQGWMLIVLLRPEFIESTQKDSGFCWWNNFRNRTPLFCRMIKLNAEAERHDFLEGTPRNAANGLIEAQYKSNQGLGRCSLPPIRPLYLMPRPTQWPFVVLTCSRLVAMAISPHVMSAPKPRHTRRNGKFPTCSPLQRGSELLLHNTMQNMLPRSRPPQCIPHCRVPYSVPAVDLALCFQHRTLKLSKSFFRSHCSKAGTFLIDFGA
jgi:hypothetical protein